MTVAALFVDPRGCYADVEDVVLWDEKRDARTYPGPHPVVAHPPCARWCRLAGLVEARWGHKRGDDGGCFESALKSVRRWGGVLEHPAYTDAWIAYGLPEPPRRGWLKTFCGGWVCSVAQGRYGHPARKRTWLYANIQVPPVMLWGDGDDPTATVSWGHYRIGDFPTNGRTNWATRDRLSPKRAAATPPAFRDALLGIARSVEVPV